MRFLRFFSPIRAVRDLRAFLAQRGRPHWGFLALSFGLTGLILVGFIKDSHFERAYEREIVYLEDWRLDRSDEDIIARQKVFQARKEKRLAEIQAAREKRQAAFKRLDDKLESWGL